MVSKDPECPYAILKETVVRVEAVHFLPRNERQVTQVQAGDIEGERPASGDIFLKQTRGCLFVLHNPDQIDKSTLEIAQADDEVYTDMQTLSDELPGHSPRYVLLSYPLTLQSGRLSVPYVLIYYMPVTCNAELRMLYAGAKELVRNTAEVGKVLEMQDAEELETIEEKLSGGE